MTVPPGRHSAPIAEPRTRPLSYYSALDWLYGFADYERRPGGHSFSLERPRALFRLLGNPQRAFRSIVVAGTKGKGSTAAMLQALLGATGRSVALYTQPHLHTFRERICVRDALISESELTAGVERLQPAVERLHRERPDLGRLTTYEIGTALALAFFAERRVDWAVLEVGLGGRLDAVNAVDAALAVLTPISLDHVDVLGPTLSHIAREKAGVIHPGGVVVSGPQPAEARDVLDQACRERGASITYVDPECVTDLRLHRFRAAAPLAELRAGPYVECSIPPRYTGLSLPLGGVHQAINAAVALASAERCEPDLSPTQARHALAGVRWPGRLEAVAERPATIVDGAHNDASAAALAQAVQDHFDYRKLTLVIGASADKDLAAILSPLLPLASTVIATEARNPRALPAAAIARQARLSGAEALATSSVAEAADLARDRSEPDDLVVISGSLYVVAEARAHFGWAQPEP